MNFRLEPRLPVCYTWLFMVGSLLSLKNYFLSLPFHTLNTPFLFSCPVPIISPSKLQSLVRLRPPPFQSSVQESSLLVNILSFPRPGKVTVLPCPTIFFTYLSLKEGIVIFISVSSGSQLVLVCSRHKLIFVEWIIKCMPDNLLSSWITRKTKMGDYL